MGLRRDTLIERHWTNPVLRITYTCCHVVYCPSYSHAEIHAVLVKKSIQALCMQLFARHVHNSFKEWTENGENEAVCPLETWLLTCCACSAIKCYLDPVSNSIAVNVFLVCSNCHIFDYV